MTEDAVGVCSILNRQLTEAIAVPSEASAVAQLDGALYLNSNMTVDGSCLYTTTDLTGSFPEGTVLQILPDSTILAVPPLKDASNHNLNNNTIIFKDPSFIGELSNAQSTTPVSNLSVESESRNGLQMSDVPICSEAHMSDIDLSFLTETVESISTSSSKALNDAALKELQGTIGAQSLDVLEDDSSNNGNSPKDPEEPAEDVVMIDVSKPIQLSQNSLIMVNGQRCVLQHTQSGQVVAYPVKEQEKPRRRRGRPRKASIEQVSNDTSLEASPEPENASDDEREHGLLEIVNDDGSLVRRSTRRRKKTKVLKDYETGNLKQELGSDVDDGDLIEIDTDLSRRRKPKGPGRPRKIPIPEPIVSGIKRNRGRPRKQVFENEPTQAFLVQTADGQTLMMQVPLSSIPPGVSLQEVAQNIANRLNVGLGHTQTSATTETLNVLQPTEKCLNNQNLESTSEPAVQDHSIGSTTNLCNIEQFQSMESTENNCDNSGHNISTDAVVDSVSDSEVIEVTLNSVNERNVHGNQPDGFLPENMLQTKAQFSNLEMPQSPNQNFSLNVPTSISSTTDMSSSLSRLTNQICTSKTEDQDLETNFNQFQIPKDFLISGDFMKGKMNLQDLLENVVSNTESRDVCSESTNGASNKENDSLNVQEEYSLNANDDLKDFEADLAAQILDNEKRMKQKQESSQEESNLDKTETMSNNYDFLTSELSNSILCTNTEKVPVPNEAIISSIKHDHNLLVQSTPISEVKETSNNFDKSKILKSKISAIKQAFQPILPLEKITPNLEMTASDGSIFSVPTMAVVPVSSDQLQLSEKILPIILPSELPGSMKCKICQRLYFTEEELIKHFKAEHPKCICKQCNYMSEFSYIMKRHCLRHVENGIVCEICGKHYKDHYILKMHIKMVHLPAEVVFTCEICDKKFTRKAHLKRHLRIHEPNRPYKCSFCNYRGCEKSDITKHILIHEAPKHTCHICGKAFRHIKNKELHLKRHFKQRDYKCGICNFYGYTFTDIRKHIERRHTDAKSSTCLSCGTVFKSKDMLEEHVSSGQCKMSLVEGQPIKQESGEMEESSALEDMSLDVLETEQSEEPSPTENDSQYKASVLHPGQLIMSSDGILSTHNGQILVNGLEGTEFLSSENLPFLTVGNDSSKLITLVTNDGKNYTLPLKDSGSASETADHSLILNPNNKVENLFLSALQEGENT